MQIYLPIAEIPLDILTLLLLGGVAGFLAGMLGIGGGFLMTPMLIFLGVTPAVAVASSANQIVASSFSGFLAHLRKNNVDFKMGGFLLIGGLIGSTGGARIFAYLKELGYIDIVISLSYVLFLGSIGLMMGVESYKSITKRKNNSSDDKPKKTKKSNWQDKLPFKVNFTRSDMQVSAILPVIVGIFSGLIVSIMGIGGGFITIPAMIYLLKIPTSVVVGTSLFQMILTTSNVTFFHAYYSNTVDVVLAMLLLTGSVIGAQFGTKMGFKIAPDSLRGLLAIMVLVVAGRMAMELLVTPANPFSVVVSGS